MNKLSEMVDHMMNADSVAIGILMNGAEVALKSDALATGDVDDERVTLLFEETETTIRIEVDKVESLSYMDGCYFLTLEGGNEFFFHVS